MNIQKCEPFDKQGFADRLNIVRFDTSKNKKDFAYMCGYTPEQYRKFEDPKVPQTPSLPAFHLMVQLGNTSPGYLLNGVGPQYIDMKSARKLQSVMDAALNYHKPNYGVLLQRAKGLTENQLQLLIDLIPTVSNYDPKLKIEL